jgi:hypothetical protein
MKIVLCLILLTPILTGCSVPRFIAGEVAHQVITCTSSASCKERLAKDCPHGGILHGVRQAVEVEYSCNK